GRGLGTSRRLGFRLGRRLILLGRHGSYAGVTHQHQAAFGGYVRLVAQHRVGRPRRHVLERGAPLHYILALLQGLVNSRTILEVLLQVFYLAGRLTLVVEVTVVGEADLFEVVGPFLPLGRLLHAAASQQEGSDHGNQGDAHDALRNAWHGWTPLCCCITRP